jgi:ATP-dependent exoDNAse (exonuclease V) alpha subunit
MPELGRPEVTTDFYFVAAEEPESAVSRIVELVKTRIPRRFGFDPIRDVQVLCPMNRGGCGARSLNIELQAALNPVGEQKVERADGIERYLSSGMVRGVGPVYAKKLVHSFGEKVFEVIEATPERLREVDGIGPVRAASIVAAWLDFRRRR